MTQSTRANAAASNLQDPIDPSTVNGWGVDADPDNDPTWPIRNRAGDPGPGVTWDRPALQQPDVEILQSVEHVRRPAVLGESTPPSGLSGVLRRQAFQLSESQWGHWLMLMLADRINAVEGLVDDVRCGIVPNPLVETGTVPRRYARVTAFLTLATVGVAVSALILGARRRDRQAEASAPVSVTECS